MKRKTRKLSIKTKILLVTILVIACLFLVLGVNIYQKIKADMVSMGVEQAEIAARMAVRQADGDIIAALKPGDEESEGYQSQLDALTGMKEDCSVAFLYTLSTDGQKVYYGIDTDDSSMKCEIGEEFECSLEELQPVFAGDRYVQDYIDYTEDGELITVYLPIIREDGSVAAVLGSDYDASVIVKRLADLRTRIIVICIVGIIAAMLALNLVIGGIMRGLRSVNNKIYELVHNEGDLTQTLDVKTGDELELMADDVNELLHYIRGIMIQISDNSGHLNDSTKAVFGKLTRAGENIMDVSAAMEQMGASMEETTASLNQLSKSVAEVYEHVSLISQNAAEGNSKTEVIAQNTEEIRRKTQTEQKDAYALAEELAAAVNDKIEKSKSVKEINVLTENILEITEQTNLLALNASIEAARAGEAGKGFAVVAGEIGKLASDSAQAAARIRQVSEAVITSVEELAAEAEKMIHFMEDTAMEGFRSLMSMSENFHTDAEEIHGIMERFAEGSAQVTQITQDIREAIEAVNEAVEENTKSVMNVSESSTELSESVEDIEKKADMNRQIAQQLEAEVGKFKLE